MYNLIIYIYHGPGPCPTYGYVCMPDAQRRAARGTRPEGSKDRGGKKTVYFSPMGAGSPGLVKKRCLRLRSGHRNAK